MRAKTMVCSSRHNLNHLALRIATGVLLLFLLISSPFEPHAQDYDSLIQSALELRNAGDFAGAESILREAQELATETNEVSYLLGLILAFQEKFTEAAEVIEAGLERYPNDQQLLLAKARVLSFQSNFTEAGEITDSVLERDPNNLEALSLRANLFRFQQQYSSARETYSAILDLDAQNLESMIGLYDTEIGAGNLETAEFWLSRAEAQSPQHTDVITRRLRRAPSTRHHSITSGAAISSFDTAALNRWYDRFLEYRYETEGGTQVYIRGEHAHRFDNHDTMYEVGTVILLPRRGYLEMSGGFTNNNDFLPENRVRVAATFNVAPATENFGATALGFSAMRSKYVTGDVTALGVNLTHYLLSYNAWLTPGIGFIEDERGNNNFNWQIGGHWQINGRTRMGYTYGHSPETENSFTTTTDTHHLYFNYQLTDSISLRIDASSHDRENSYLRENYGLSLNFRY